MNILTLLLSSIFYLALILLEKIIGTHVFFVAGIYSLIFFSSVRQQMWIFLFLGLMHDALFWLPIGSSFLLTVPFLLYFPYISRFVHSRMIAFCVSVAGTALVFAFMSLGKNMQPYHIMFTLLLSIVVTVFYYFFIFNHPTFRGTTSSQVSWRF